MGLSARGEVVMLNGQVNSYPGAALVEHVVLRVGDIVAVAASHRHGGSRR